MKKFLYLLRLIFGTIGFFLLFILNFIYIFVSLLTLSLGLIIFPCALLGMTDILVVTGDFGLPVLFIGGLGAFILGGGMCMGAFFVCKGSLNRFNAFNKGNFWRKKRLRDEKV